MNKALNLSFPNTIEGTWHLFLRVLCPVTFEGNIIPHLLMMNILPADILFYSLFQWNIDVKLRTCGAMGKLYQYYNEHPLHRYNVCCRDTNMQTAPADTGGKWLTGKNSLRVIMLYYHQPGLGLELVLPLSVYGNMINTFYSIPGYWQSQTNKADNNNSQIGPPRMTKQGVLSGNNDIGNKNVLKMWVSKVAIFPQSYVWWSEPPSSHRRESTLSFLSQKSHFNI